DGPPRRQRPDPDPARAAPGQRHQAAGGVDRELLPAGVRPPRGRGGLRRDRAGRGPGGDPRVVSAGVLVWPWLGAALRAGVVAVVVRAWRTRRRRAEPDRWVANTDYLDQVPALRAAL